MLRVNKGPSSSDLMALTNVSMGYYLFCPLRCNVARKHGFVAFRSTCSGFIIIWAILTSKALLTAKGFQEHLLFLVLVDVSSKHHVFLDTYRFTASKKSYVL